MGMDLPLASTEGSVMLPIRTPPLVCLALVLACRSSAVDDKPSDTDDLAETDVADSDSEPGESDGTDTDTHTADTDWPTPEECDAVDCTLLDWSVCEVNLCCMVFGADIYVGGECPYTERFCLRAYYPKPEEHVCAEGVIWVDHHMGPGCMSIGPFNCLPPEIRNAPCEDDVSTPPDCR